MDIRYREFLDANREKYEAEADRVAFEDVLCDFRGMQDVRSLPYPDLVHTYFCRMQDAPENHFVLGWKNPRYGLDSFVRDNPYILSAEIAAMFGVSDGVVRGIKAYQTMQRNADLQNELASQQDEQWSDELDWEMYPAEYFDAIMEPQEEDEPYPFH